MNRHAHRLQQVLGTIAITFAAACVPSLAAAADEPQPTTRVRSEHPTIARLITEATERSATFRGEVAAINDTDGLVYVHDGQCGRGVRGCLQHTVELAGPYRLLRILVDLRGSDAELMALIGHELRHALEVLSDPRIRTDNAISWLYRQVPSAATFAFETEAAQQAGWAVRAELRAYAKH